MDGDGSRPGGLVEGSAAWCGRGSKPFAGNSAWRWPSSTAADYFVIGGPADAVQRFEGEAPALGIPKARRLPVTVGLHTPLLTAAGESLTLQLEKSALVHPTVPVLAGIAGEVVRRRERAIATLGRQVYQPVHWDSCLQTAVEMGCTVFLEIGPGSALSQMVREAFPELKARGLEEFRSIQGAADWVLRNLE